MARLDFAHLPVVIKYKGPVAGLILMTVGLLTVLSVTVSQNGPSVIWVSLGVICFLFGIFSAGRRKIVEIDESLVRAKHTGPFNWNTDWEEPVQAYRAVCIYPWVIEYELVYQVSLDHPDKTKTIVITHTSNRLRAMRLCKDAANVLHLPTEIHTDLR